MRENFTPMTTAMDKHLAAALGRLPSGLFVLTLKSGETETGMLASWVQQCSFSPPCLTAAVQRGREISGFLAAGATFSINILEENQTDMIAHFGRGFALTEDAFAGLDCQRGQANGPILTEALAYLHCRVQNRFAVGDHDLIVAEVFAGQMLADGQPMVHIRKNGMHY